MVRTLQKFASCSLLICKSCSITYPYHVIRTILSVIIKLLYCSNRVLIIFSLTKIKIPRNNNMLTELQQTTACRCILHIMFINNNYYSFIFLLIMFIRRGNITVQYSVSYNKLYSAILLAYPYYMINNLVHLLFA